MMILNSIVMGEIDRRLFGQMIFTIIEKLKVENNILKIENKVLREFITSKGFSIPNAEIVDQMPSQDPRDEGPPVFPDALGD